MAEDRKRGLTSKEREAAKAAFESGESLRAIARRTGCRYATLHAIRNREGWTVSETVSLRGPGETQALRARAQAQVIDIATKRAVDEIEKSGVIGEIVDHLALSQHAKKLAAQLTARILEDTLAGAIEPARHQGEQTKVDVAHRAIAMWKTFSTGYRDDGGFRPGVPTATSGEESGVADKIEFVVVSAPPEKTGTNDA